MYMSPKNEGKQFNHHKHVHLIFYSVIDNQIFYLLLKNLKSISKPFSEFYTEMTNFDNAPTFAASRLMTCNYNGLLTKKFIQETAIGNKINKEDFEEEFSWYELWNSNNYWEWLEQLSNNPIQFDKLDSRMIYFIEIPYMDVGKLQINFNLLHNSKFYEFKYFTLEEIINESGLVDFVDKGIVITKCINVSHILGKIFKLIDPDKHIKQTITNFSNDSAEKVYIISCKPSESNKKDQAGIYHFRALFQGLYRNNNEKWIFLTASIDGLPNDEMLKNTKAVIIPGSHISVYDDYEYLIRTKDFIYNLAKNYSDIKILGICFGAQIVAESLGGKVLPMKREYFSGIESIQLSKHFWDLEFVKKSGVSMNDNMELLKFHGDEIKYVPAGFQLFGTSQSCKNEILVSESKKILLIQGHPEYETRFVFVRSLSKKMRKNRNGKLAEKYIQNFSKEIRYYDENNFRKICFSFLKNE